MSIDEIEEHMVILRGILFPQIVLCYSCTDEDTWKSVSQAARQVVYQYTA
jgi:hypothetical protein